jgi:3-hydroxybutyryl-CoA dehydrogenase
VGAGLMGRGVAQNLAQSGHNVVLFDSEPTVLSLSKRLIRQSVRLQGLFAAGERSDDVAMVMSRVQLASSLEDMREAEFVIENVTEVAGIKRRLFAELDTICREACIFASNTSAIPITHLAAATGRPSKFIGTHFMNPVPLSRAVELVRGYYTSEETIELTRQLLAGMGKECILVNDSPGFVSNRVLMPMINEAIYLVHEDVAPPETVDTIFRSCLGHKMGPLATADLIGLDTILNTLEVLLECFGDSKYRPCPLLRQMVDAGLTGQKSGQGFFSYPTLGLATAVEEG